MNRTLLLETVLCLGVALSTAACGKNVTAASVRDDTGPHPVKVEPDMDANNFTVEHPERFPLATAGEYVASPELNVTGVVNPDVSRQVPVPSLASGRVVEIAARLGDEVKKGQLLFKVRSTDIAGAFSDYHKAVRNEQLAKIQLDRAKLLYDDGAVPKSALDTTQIRFVTNGRSGNDQRTSALVGRRSRPSKRNRRGLRAGFGSDHRSTNRQRIRCTGFDSAESLHDLRRVTYLDYL